ncbi:hypothetical protein SDC9_51648 [bioreactor metagenome]|uniref:AbiEi antitoxin C-terminal domain-containing protein n=1 Tax=bioreactor metagenome TaxID=1076179 RepID=A0A644WNX1_9ZZZZ
MTRSEILLNAIRRFPSGKIFSYSELADTQLKHSIMVAEMNQLVKRGQIARVMRGRFVALSGETENVSSREIIEAICHYRNKICGYETGPSVWEKWGLVPVNKKRKEYYVAITQMRPAQQHGDITIRFKRAKLDPAQYNHQIMQFLDAMEAVNTIEGKIKTDFFDIMSKIFRSWNESTRNQLANHAMAYRPVTRALVGALLQSEGYAAFSGRLAASLHPATLYKIKADCSKLPNVAEWRVVCDKSPIANLRKTKTSKKTE